MKLFLITIFTFFVVAANAQLTEPNAPNIPFVGGNKSTEKVTDSESKITLTFTSFSNYLGKPTKTIIETFNEKVAANGYKLVEVNDSPVGADYKTTNYSTIKKCLFKLKTPFGSYKIIAFFTKGKCDELKWNGYIHEAKRYKSELQTMGFSETDKEASNGTMKLFYNNNKFSAMLFLNSPQNEVFCDIGIKQTK